MDLVEKLLRIPERENAGARSSNRFSFQQVWAFDYMLKIIEYDINFILFMEFHDDVIVLSESEQHQYLDFFQSFTACEGLRTVRIIYLSSPVKAPVAFTMVAPRCRSFWIKSQIHVALEVTT